MSTGIKVMNTARIDKLLALRKFKAEYTDKLKRIKAAEDKITGEIIKDLETSEVNKITYHGYTISRSEKDHFEVTDQEVFLGVMFDDMSKAKLVGEKLSSVCLLQKTPAKLMLKSMIQDEAEKSLPAGAKEEDIAKKFLEIAEKIGLRYVVTNDLSVRKA